MVGCRTHGSRLVLANMDELHLRRTGDEDVSLFSSHITRVLAPHRVRYLHPRSARELHGGSGPIGQFETTEQVLSRQRAKREWIWIYLSASVVDATSRKKLDKSRFLEGVKSIGKSCWCAVQDVVK